MTAGEHERLCAMEHRLCSGRILPAVGFEPATRSVNCSATKEALALPKPTGNPGTLATKHHIAQFSRPHIHSIFDNSLTGVTARTADRLQLLDGLTVKFRAYVLVLYCRGALL